MIYRSKETVCSITVPRDPEYLALVQDILEHPLVRSMEAYTQHGETSCLRHSINVSYLSYLYCRDHGWQARAAARAGLLHDMFLSDRETTGIGLWKHLRIHPQMALKNAMEYGLSPLEKDIILKHMWPVTMSKLPRYRESLVVNLADKICTVCEVLRLYRMLGVRKRLGHLNQSARSCPASAA